MNILIPSSWLKDYLDTNATPQQFADAMSLASVSIEHMEKVDDDIVFDIEVTTNRPDLMSIHGIAREASAILPQAGFKAKFKPKSISYYTPISPKSTMVDIVIDPTLVNRILAVVMDIDLGPSPKLISDRLEKTGIRSINNAVDVTNYIMREVGHPSHVFDYDRLKEHKLIIRKSKKGEKIETLDGKTYELLGNDIVADNGTGEIIDLLGVMGTNNSAVTPETKRILLFIDNNNPHLLRKTSMSLGIRTEAAILNEKGVSPEIMLPTLLHGIELLKKIANGKVVSNIIDIYPNKPKIKKVTLAHKKIDSVIGVSIPEKTIISILENLGFKTNIKGNTYHIEVPFIRSNDIEIPEDIIEEVARVYGYHKIPNVLPPTTKQSYYHQDKNEFYWITQIKNAFRFWGYNETYTYSMVSEELFDGPVTNAIKLKNPLTDDRTFLRNAIVPSLLEVLRINKNISHIKLFEIANVYSKKPSGLPIENQHIAIAIKNENASFYDAKGLIEQIFAILGITNFSFTKKDDGIDGAEVEVMQKKVGHIEIEEEITIELNLTEILKHANAKKIYIAAAKFPPVIEDMRVEIAPHYTFARIEKAIKSVSDLVYEVSLLDVYESKKTFHVTFLDRLGNLTNEDIAPIRAKIYQALEKEFKAKMA